MKFTTKNAKRKEAKQQAKLVKRNTIFQRVNIHSAVWRRAAVKRYRKLAAGLALCWRNERRLAGMAR